MENSVDTKILNNKNEKEKPKKKRNRGKKKIEKSQFLEYITEEQEKINQEVEFEYVAAKVIDEKDSKYEEIEKIFSKFMKPEDSNKKEESKEETEEIEELENPKDNPDEKQGLSRRKKKKLRLLEVAKLKLKVDRPDVVEVNDIDAKEPEFLIYLKSYKNTIPVPKHWAQKRKYLQSKRGIEKQAFQLPEYIQATGITKLRENTQKKSVKVQARERMNPKLGKLDIDYQILHDAFFKYQTKPVLTGFGDVYFEGREFEIRLKHLQPGKLSDKLRKALGMPQGDDVPPPWLLNMQKFGPPPGYPKLKLPGVNAPLPPGAQWGYGPGLWGKPSLDQNGKPLWGDVYSTNLTLSETEKENIDTSLWGQLEEVIYIPENIDVKEKVDLQEEEPIQEMEEVEIIKKEENKEEKTSTTLFTPPPSIEIPEELDLRKTREEPKPLYQILDQKESGIKGNIMGSKHTYNIPEKRKEIEKEEIDPKKKKLN